jgi:hypothetical protein
MGIQVRKVPVNLKLEGEAAPSDSAAVHYARSSQCNKSMHGIKVVTVQLNTRPQHIGDGVAGAGGPGAPGAWRPQPAPARRAGTMTLAEIS